MRQPKLKVADYILAEQCMSAVGSHRCLTSDNCDGTRGNMTFCHSVLLARKGYAATAGSLQSLDEQTPPQIQRQLEEKSHVKVPEVA